MTDTGIHQRRCQLPVIRKILDEETDLYTRAIAICGEPLFVSHEEQMDFEVEGEGGGCGSMWKVGCHNGHVLLVPDHEADDNFDLIPFELAVVNEALTSLDGSSGEAR